ncbi:MAG: calcium/sodium antiporter [Clostridia bacterium]|nr:calcium/sodium antiporter [Clostridia bacterium]
MFDWLYSFIFSNGVWQNIFYIIFLVIGFVLLIKGADTFVNSASIIAKAFKIPTIVIGMTIVAFGTSAPEAAVSISSAVSDSVGVCVGNIVGSNMFNLLVVLGLSAVFMPVVVERSVVKTDVLFMTLASVLLMVFALIFGQNGNFMLIRIECIIMLLLIIAYVTWSVIKVLKNNKDSKVEETTDSSEKKPNILVAILLLVVGLAGIVVGGDFVVFGAKNIAISMGASELLVGLTIVAVGTSLPELMTSLIAIRRKENEIALGNVIGSNLFNILFILGMSGTISPLPIAVNALIDIIIVTVVSVAFLIYCWFRKDINRATGIVMVSMYVAYLVYIVLRDFVFVM